MGPKKLKKLNKIEYMLFFKDGPESALFQLSYLTNY